MSTLKIIGLVTVVSTLLTLGCGSDGEIGPDIESPVLNSVAIAEGDDFVLSVGTTLSLSATDNRGVTHVRISEDAEFTGAPWVAYSGSPVITLTPGDGTKTVYVQVKDEAGLESAVLSDDIVLSENSTVVYFDPDPIAIEPGSTGTVRLFIENASALLSGRFVISFATSQLEVVNVTIDTGTDHILRSTGAAVLASDTQFDNEGENGFGTVTVGALAVQSGFQGVAGSGPFAEVTFRLKTSIPDPITIEILSYEIYEYPLDSSPVAAGNVFTFSGFVSEQ